MSGSSYVFVDPPKAGQLADNMQFRGADLEAIAAEIHSELQVGHLFDSPLTADIEEIGDELRQAATILRVRTGNVDRRTNLWGWNGAIANDTLLASLFDGDPWQPTMGGESAMYTVADDIHAVEQAAGTDPDGEVTLDELEAALDSGALVPATAAAVQALLDDRPLLSHLLAASNDELYAIPEDSHLFGLGISDDGLRAVADENEILRTLALNWRLIDTANGGGPDGTGSLSDIERVAANDGGTYPADVVAAAQYYLDHPKLVQRIGYAWNNEHAYVGSYGEPYLDWMTATDVDPYDGEPATLAVYGAEFDDLLVFALQRNAFDEHPDAAYGLTQLFPNTADPGVTTGLPITLVSSESFHPLANAALRHAGTDLTMQHAVIANLPETTNADRNRLINAFYEVMAEEMDAILAGSLAGNPTATGHPGINWAHAAPWASNSLRPVLTGEFSAFGVISPSMPDRQAGADGNQFIFTDVGGRYLAFIEAFGDGGWDDASTIETFFEDTFGEGDAHAQAAFVRYLQVLNTTDAELRQEYQLQANALIAVHEQSNADIWIDRALDQGGFMGFVAAALSGSGNLDTDREIGTSLIDFDAGGVLLPVDQEVPLGPSENNLVQMLSLVSDLEIGGLGDQSSFMIGDVEVQIGGDGSADVQLAPIGGVDSSEFSTSFAAMFEGGGGDYDLHVVPAGDGSSAIVRLPVGTDPDSLDGTDALRWDDYDDRMWFIVNMFQQNHTNPALVDTSMVEDIPVANIEWLDPDILGQFGGGPAD